MPRTLETDVDAYGPRRLPARLAEIGSRPTPMFSDSQRFEHLNEVSAAGTFDAVVLDGTDEHTVTLLYSLRKHAS